MVRRHSVTEKKYRADGPELEHGARRLLALELNLDHPLREVVRAGGGNEGHTAHEAGREHDLVENESVLLNLTGVNLNKEAKPQRNTCRTSPKMSPPVIWSPTRKPAGVKFHFVSRLRALHETPRGR